MPPTSKTPKRPPRTLFEEPILVKYSPHHELPLSSVSSLGIHALVIGLIIIVGIIIAKLNWNSEEKPIDADAVTMEPVGGGGGNPDGVGKGPADGATTVPPPPADALPDSNPTPSKTDRAKLDKVKKDVLTLPDFKDDPSSQRLIQDGGEAVNRFLNLKKDVRAKLNESIAGKGQGGSGSGGGKGTGQGTGEGSGVGPGRGNAERIKRTLRWVLIFNTRDGRDYKRQLNAFGAILAIPDPNTPDGYLVIRDLHSDRPQAKPEDIAEIKRIFWIDDGAASVRSLAQALGLPQQPQQFIVFFSPEFEQKLVSLEKAYRGKEENEIIETRFDVRKRGDTYEPVVVSQR
jgi:hypothetical protein